MNDQQSKVPKNIQEGADKWVKRMDDILKERFDTFELFLLKCHLLIEHELDNYIERQTRHRLSMEKANFKFSDKIKIAEMLGCFETKTDSGDNLKKFLIALNKVRNKIAHTFKYEESALQELLEIAKVYYKRLNSEFETDNASLLTLCLSYFVGMLNHNNGPYPSWSKINEKKE
jgi:hypothetical protein